MKSRSSNSTAMSWALSLALLLSSLLANTMSARADVDPRIKVWTTVGSAGTINEADSGKLVTQGPTVAFPEILPPTRQEAFQIFVPQVTVSATVRYNVVATDATVEGGPILAMAARFRDDGDQAQVVLRLFETNIETGATTLLLTLDSNNFSAQTDYQLQTVSIVPTTKPDFVNNAYFVEATLIQKRSPIFLNGGRPGLAAIQLFKAPIFNG